MERLEFMARTGDCKVEAAGRDERQDCSERRRLQASRKGEDGGRAQSALDV